MANKPNNPSLWSRAKSLAKQKFDVYPSAYANGWAAKWYKSKGGTWRKAEYGMEVPYDMEAIAGPGPKNKAKQTNPYKDVDSGAADFFRSILPVPDNVAQLAAKQLFGDARMSNASLDDRQKVMLWDVIQNAKKRTGKNNSGTEYQDYGNMGYGSSEDYNDWFNRGKLGMMDLIMKSTGNDGFKLASTIGRGRYWTDKKDPETIYYTDVYDWNPGEQNFKGTNQYQNIRNYVRKTEDKNLNADKNEKYRMNFKLNKKEIDQLRKSMEMKNQLNMGMGMFAEGGTNNPGFKALPEYVQAKILSNMAAGGEKMPPEIARARFAAAGNTDKLDDYGYGYGGYIPEYAAGGLAQQAAIAIAMKRAGKKPKSMAKGGEPNGEMALGQMAAVQDKMSKLLQFVKPDDNLDPWIASKLAVMDHSADAIADYMMYGPEAEEMEEDMQEMAEGGYTVTRSNDRKGKTHKVTGPDGTVKYFGDSKLGQHPKDPERKAAFYARHKKNLDRNPYFRAFARATWENGGEIDMYQAGGERTFLETASQFLPGYETYLDLKDIVQGGYRGDRAQMNQGAIGLGQPFAGKAVTGTLDYFTEKLGGKKLADYMGQKRSDIVNMTEREKKELVKKYGAGGYDKWVKAGKPKLNNGGYIGQDGKRHMSKTPTWSGNAGYDMGGYVPEFMPADLPEAGLGWMIPAGLAAGAMLWSNKKRKDIGNAVLPMLGGAAGFQQGGPVVGEEMEVTPEQLEQLRAQGYDFEII